MGAWGIGNFENDAAMDFACDFADNPSLSTVVEALTLILTAGKEGAYIEVDEASVALAAAELLAAGQGKPAADFPEILQAARPVIQADDHWRQRALEAVRQVVKESELRELWAESDEYDEWQTVQAALLARLH